MWWVTKGLAAAPPKIGCIKGVSTSKNPLSSRYFLTAFIIWVLLIKVSLTSGFIIKSTYLFLYLISTSVNPWYFSGRDLTFLVRRLIDLTLKVNSSVWVTNNSPSTPIISPTLSILTIWSNSFSPNSSFLMYIWIFPDWSSMWAK